MRRVRYCIGRGVPFRALYSGPVRFGAVYSGDLADDIAVFLRQAS